MDLIAYLAYHFLAFLLIFMRMLGFFMIAPVFNSRIIPLPPKIGLAFLMAVILLPQKTGPGVPRFFVFDGDFFLALLSEIMLGLALGFIAGLVFSCIQIAGEIIDFQAGFLIANVIDPFTREVSSVMGQFYLLLAIVYYLGIGGHLLTLEGLYRTFELVPLGTFMLTPAMEASILDLIQQVMILALQLGAPVIIALFLANLTLAILSRAIPQMDVFIVGLPLNIGICFLLTLLTLPYFFPLVDRLVGFFLRSFFSLLATR
ncbi:MAG TPA: flagellar biosynthetic protein FliR [Atribacteraceae bacterium]|nr:flagellar biosynthetic protein FliR [Atribacteraceae bacterium]